MDSTSIATSIPELHQWLPSADPHGFEPLLTYSDMGMYYRGVARAATTSDAFNAVADATRRDILAFLADRERSVGDIVAALEMEQPSVSKHLRVLREVGLVRMRPDGRQKLYQTNAAAIRPLHEWAGEFERFWRHTLTRVKAGAEAKAAKSATKVADATT